MAAPKPLALTELLVVVAQLGLVEQGEQAAHQELPMAAVAVVVMVEAAQDRPRRALMLVVTAVQQLTRQQAELEVP